MPYKEDIEVGILISTNCPRAIKPREVIPGLDDDPYGIKTDLGWGIVGRVCKSPPDEDVDRRTGSWTNNIVSRERQQSNRCRSLTGTLNPTKGLCVPSKLLQRKS